MNHRPSFSSRIGFVFAVLAVLFSPALLLAHARLLRSTPAENATLAVAPTSLSLWFSERPELKFSSVQLTDSAGNTIVLGALASIDTMGVTALIGSALAAGHYTISWRTAAADGHATSGKIAFTVTGTAPAPALSVTVEPSHQSRPLKSGRNANAAIDANEEVSASTAMRWIELVSVLTLVGIATFRLAVVPAARWTGEPLRDINDRLRRLANGAFVLFVISTVTRAFVQADMMVYPGSRSAEILGLVRDTRWGHGWAVGAIGGIVVLIGLAASKRWPVGWPIAAVGLIGVALGQTLTGHAAASSRNALAIATDLAHLLAAGGWLGGLTALLFTGLASVNKIGGRSASDHASRLLKSFHGTAMECVTLVVASALVSAWLRLGSVSALASTRYGNILLLKVLMVAFALGLGWYHSKRVVPAEWSGDVVASFRRTALAELLVGMVIVAITAILVSTPLPR